MMEISGQHSILMNCSGSLILYLIYFPLRLLPLILKIFRYFFLFFNYKQSPLFFIWTAQILKNWDSSRVSRYLSYFTRVPFESWALEIGKAEQKEIEDQTTFIQNNSYRHQQEKEILTLWERARGERLKKLTVTGCWGKPMTEMSFL